MRYVRIGCLMLAAHCLCPSRGYLAEQKPKYELWVYGYNLHSNAHELHIKTAKLKWQSLGWLAPDTDFGRGRDAAFVVPVPAGTIGDVVEIKTHNPRGGSWFGIIKAVYVMPRAGTPHEAATRQIQADAEAVLARAHFARVWTLDRGQTDVGIFSVETRRRHLRIGPCRPSVPDQDRRVVLQPDGEGRVERVIDLGSVWREAIVRGRADSAFYFTGNKSRLHARGTAGLPVRVSAVYRFTCERELSDVRVAARCRASNRNFAASVRLSVGADGANWPLTAKTADAANNTFLGDLALSGADVSELRGVGELWVRLDFDVRCAVDTYGGASVERLVVRGRAGRPVPGPQPTPQQVQFKEAKRTIAAKGEPQVLLLDGCAVDGLQMATMAGDRVSATAHEDAACRGGIDAGFSGDGAAWRLTEELVPKAPRYSHPGLRAVPYALTAPLRTDSGGSPVLVEVGYRAGPQGSPRMTISWDGEQLSGVDTRNPYHVLRLATVAVPADRAEPGQHELTIADADGDVSATNAVTVDAVRVTSLGTIAIAPPEQPKPGGPLPLSLHCAYFRPDGNPDAVQLAGLPRHFKKDFDYTTGGALHAYVQNRGNEPVQLRDVLLFGKPIDQWRRPFKSIWRPDEESGVHTLEFDRPEVLWHRVLPETVEPGRVAELLVRFSRAPTADRVPIELRDVQGRVAKFDVNRQPPGLTLRSAAFSKALDRLALTVVCPPGDSVASVHFDGADVTSHCIIRPTGLPSRLWLVQVNLRSPAEQGSYHVIRLGSASEKQSAAALRAEPAFFSIGLFGNQRQILDRRAKLHVNTFVGHGVPDADLMAQAESLDMRMLVQFQANINEYRHYPALHAYYLLDEADARDDPLVLGRSRWIGRQSHDLEYHFQRALRRLDPAHPCFFLCNQTTMPLNWFIYGQLSDIFCTDPYSYNPRYVRAVARTARRASLPRPCWIAVKSYWRPGSGRPVSPEEARLMVYAAVGEGVAGISYWIYDKRVSGWSGMAASPPLEAEASRVNAELETAASLLAYACPTDAVRTDNPKAMARALLCADKGMAVVVMNESYDITKESLRVSPLKNVKVTVQVPPFLGISGATLLEGTTQRALPVSREDGAVSFTLDELRVANLVLLTTKD